MMQKIQGSAPGLHSHANIGINVSCCGIDEKLPYVRLIHAVQGKDLC